MSAIKTLAIVLAILVGSFIAYFVYWNYQWKRAESAATKFCGSVTVGSDVSTAIALAKAMEKRVADGLQDGQARYAVFFQGPIFNAFICEFTAVDGKVTSKRLIEPDD